MANDTQPCVRLTVEVDVDVTDSQAVFRMSLPDTDSDNLESKLTAAVRTIMRKCNLINGAWVRIHVVPSKHQ